MYTAYLYEYFQYLCQSGLQIYKREKPEELCPQMDQVTMSEYGQGPDPASTCLRALVPLA